MSERVRGQNRIRGLLVSRGLPAPAGAKAWTPLGLAAVAPRRRLDHVPPAVGDPSGFTGPEIVHRLDLKPHIGFVVAADMPEAVGADGLPPLALLCPP